MKPKLIRLTTVPISLHKLIKGQPKYMQEHGFDLRLVSANGNETALIKEETGISVKTFPYTRVISPYTDFKALWLTYKYFRKEKPQIVHSHTAKAGIVAMLAAKFAGIPIRMHTVAGLPLMEANGIKRKVLNFVERLTSWSATHVYPNSFTLKAFMEKEKLAPYNKLKVISNGSSNGINTSDFSKEHFSHESLINLKNKLNIQINELVFCFVGRIVKDKGINELLEAFEELTQIDRHVRLILVGSEERELDPISTASHKILNNNKQIIAVGYQEDVRPYLAISDVFVFPSYREGFPNVVMQAGAMGLPCIVTNINGSNEIIEDGKNGIIVPVKNEQSLFEKMKLLFEDIELREKLSTPARKMIVNRYEQVYIWETMLEEYMRLLDENKINHKVNYKK